MKISTKNSPHGLFYDLTSLNKWFHKYKPIEIDTSGDIIISPVEASPVVMGKIEEEGTIISKNNKRINLEELVGDYAEKFIGGNYINLYLSPGNKHFFVTPYDGRFIYTKKNDGKSILPIPVLLETHGDTGVLSKAVRRNASIGSVFQTDKDFLIALIAVGSLNVNRITVEYEEGKHYKKGTPYGYFSLGSSMLLCFPGYLDILVKENTDVKIGQGILRMYNLAA